MFRGPVRGDVPHQQRRLQLLLLLPVGLLLIRGLLLLLLPALLLLLGLQLLLHQKARDGTQQGRQA